MFMSRFLDQIADLDGLEPRILHDLLCRKRSFVSGSSMFLMHERDCREKAG